MSDVYEHTGDNPPGLDVLSKHDTVVWKHPQHGWLKAGKSGGFSPISEADVTRLKGPVPKPSPSPGAVGAPTTGAGSSTANIHKGMNLQQRYDERKRAKTEGEVQGTLDRAKFAPQERADPMAGLGLVERAEVARLVREGKSPEEAAAEVKRKTAGAQAEALKQ